MTWMPYRTATPVNRSLGTWLGSKLRRIQRRWSHCRPNHGRRDAADMPETTSHRLQYHVLPDDPLAALNILREAAGLEPWPAQGTEPK